MAVSVLLVSSVLCLSYGCLSSPVLCLSYGCLSSPLSSPGFLVRFSSLVRCQLWLSQFASVRLGCLSSPFQFAFSVRHQFALSSPSVRPGEYSILRFLS